MTGLLLALARDVGPISREAARRAAQDELSKPAYHRGEPSLLERWFTKFLEQIDKSIGKLTSFTPGGSVTLIVLLLVIALAIVAIRLGLGPLRRRDKLVDERRDAASRTAAEYRAEAERLAAQGNFKEAVRARTRAVVRELEERGVLDPRPGRTAHEIATEASRAVPAITRDVATVADGFDEVWYGGRVADLDRYSAIARADDAVRSRRLAVVGDA